ncbi:MAG: ribosome silencing factor [Gemmatimonadetes bacterium]|nr:ribosome silencing factor [Gemmatimonadota bacterium]MBT7863875.1 ribosome silencing factor [Gemmatimonadota bacterium]
MPIDWNRSRSSSDTIIADWDCLTLNGDSTISTEEFLARDERLRLIVETLQDKKALDVVALDLQGLSDSADYFIICTGMSDPHVRSIGGDLVDALRQAGHRPWHVEGLDSLRWVLVDLVDVVIHVFRHEAREFYALERLWGDAEAVRFEDLENQVEATPQAEPGWHLSND